jgi:hypothetical protein
MRAIIGGWARPNDVQELTHWNVQNKQQMQRKIDFPWKMESPLVSFISREFEKTIETAPLS